MMKRLFPLYLIVFFSYFAYSMTIPIFTAMMILPTDPEIIQIPAWQRTITLGALLATYPIGQFFGGSILGALSDHFGKKKVLSISLIIATICFIGIAFAIWSLNMPLLFASLFVAGFSESNVAIAQKAIADIVPKKRRTKKIGFIFAFRALGVICAMITAAIFVNSKIVSWFDYWTPFVLVPFFLLFCLFWTFFSFKETIKAVSWKKLHYFDKILNLKNVFTDKKLRFYFLINALVYFSVYGFLRTISIHAAGVFNANVTMISVIVGYVNIWIFLMNFFVMKWVAKRVSDSFTTKVATFFFGIFLIITSVLTSFTALWYFLIPTSVFAAACLSSCTSMISHAANKNNQGSVMGNNLSLLGGMQALAAFTGGALAALAYYCPLLIFGAVAIIVSFLLFSKRKRREIP